MMKTKATPKTPPKPANRKSNAVRALKKNAKDTTITIMRRKTPS
jgi:hypothetical protein